MGGRGSAGVVPYRRTTHAGGVVRRCVYSGRPRRTQPLESIEQRVRRHPPIDSPLPDMIG